MWSLLPSDVLAIIKDKLDIFDVASVNFVCRNWWLASKSYPERHTVGDGMPWIMIPGMVGNTLEVIRITRKKKITIDLPDFGGGQILFSKQGWVLVRLCKDTRSYQKMPRQLLLLNPLTKDRIKLPQYAIGTTAKGYEPTYLASFSIDKGRPHRVVLYLYDGLDTAFLTLSIALVGDEMWTHHSYEMQKIRCMVPLISLLVIEQVVYCCYLNGKMVIYDSETQVWKEAVEHPEEITNLCKNFARPFYLDYDGQVILSGSYGWHSSPCDLFYFYCSSSDAWKQLSDDFKNDKSIVFQRYIGSFICLRQECFKVYYNSDLEVFLADWGMDYNAEDEATWVDIG